MAHYNLRTKERQVMVCCCCGHYQQRHTSVSSAMPVRGAGEAYTKKIVVHTSAYTSTGRLVGAYTSPGRWGAHYTTVLPYTTPQKKIGSVYVYTSLNCVRTNGKEERRRRVLRLYRRQFVGPERSFALSVWFPCRRFCASRLRVSLCVLHALLFSSVVFFCVYFIGCFRRCAQRTTFFIRCFFFFVYFIGCFRRCAPRTTLFIRCFLFVCFCVPSLSSWRR